MIYPRTIRLLALAVQYKNEGFKMVDNDVPDMRPGKTEDLSACKMTLVHAIVEIYVPCSVVNWAKEVNSNAGHGTQSESRWKG
jgi:hypothetical protein